jgi:hypothetical protein
VNTLWRGLADTVIGVHFAYLAYLIVGGFIAWRWPKTFAIHVLAAVWAALIVTTKVPCPLTALQNQLREQAGERPLSDSFINVYVRGTFYPEGRQSIAQAAMGVVVLASWFVLLYRWRTRSRTHVKVS